MFNKKKFVVKVAGFTLVWGAALKIMSAAQTVLNNKLAMQQLEMSNSSAAAMVLVNENVLEKSLFMAMLLSGIFIFWTEIRYLLKWR